MNIGVIDIIEIIITVLCCITFALMVYFKVRGNILGGVSELIALAEQTGLAGSEKMSQVVESLYDKVPAFLKGVLNKDRLQKIAQWIFDWMRKYADAYTDAKALSNADEACDKIGKEAAAELLAAIFDATLIELKEQAEKLGIQCDDLKTKSDFAKAIAKAIIEQA